MTKDTAAPLKFLIRVIREKISESTKLNFNQKMEKVIKASYFELQLVMLLLLKVS